MDNSTIKEYYEGFFAYKFDQWKRVENLETDSVRYSQLVIIKGTKAIRWKKDSLFNKRCWCWRTDCAHAKIKNNKEKGTKEQTLCLTQKLAQMDFRLNCKVHNYKMSRRKHQAAS